MVSMGFSFGDTVSVRLDQNLYLDVVRAATKRKMDPDVMFEKIVKAIVMDDLFDALLEE